MIIAYNAVCALVGYLFLTRPLSDVLPWFSEAPKFALAGWNFWDYVKLSLLLQGTISLCIELLFYDRTSKRNIQETQKTGFAKQVVYVMLTVTILFGLFTSLDFLFTVPLIGS